MIQRISNTEAAWNHIETWLQAEPLAFAGEHEQPPSLVDAVSSDIEVWGYFNDTLPNAPQAALVLRHAHPGWTEVTIETLIANPLHRRQHHGSRLVNALLAELANDGRSACHAHSKRDNQAAHAFWASIGFELRASDGRGHHWVRAISDLSVFEARPSASAP